MQKAAQIFPRRFFSYFFPRIPARNLATIARVIDMTGMNRLIGLPVIWEGRQIGTVMRGVVAQDGKRLRGLVVRGGLRASRWIAAEDIALLGRLSVISRQRPARLPRCAGYRLFRVTDADGARIGVVTDVVLDEKSLRVTALEISSGPVDDLLSGRWFATAFDVKSGGATGRVTIPCRPSGKEE